MKKFYIVGYACQRRNLELGQIYNFFIKNGWVFTHDSVQADIIVLGSCAFIDPLKRMSVSLIEEVIRPRKESAKVVVYGCLPAISPEALSPFRIDCSITPKNIELFDELIKAEVPIFSVENYFTVNTGVNTYYVCEDGFASQGGGCIEEAGEDGLAYLRVSTGCDGQCSYCIERFAFGGHRSYPLERLKNTFLQLVAMGYREIRIIGDDPGAYGSDIDSSLPALLAELHMLALEVRFRVTDLNPRWLLEYEKSFLKLVKKVLFTQILVPIQSGSSRILRRMQRDVDMERLARVIRNMISCGSPLRLKYHTIIGFPGETDEDFQQTLDFVDAAPPAAVSIYRCSLPAGSPAKQYDDQVDEQVTVDRCLYFRDSLISKGIEAVYFE